VQGHTAPRIVHDVLGRPGARIDARTLEFFESRLGHDFGDVRIHADAQAGASARAVDALAYTVGRNVVFAPGQYNPATTAGRALLAHELTHTAQQGAICSVPTNLVVAGADTSHEHEARAAGSAIEAPNAGAVVATPSAGAVQRQPATSLRDQICYSGTPPAHGAGECDTREPENCPTYEQWISSFGRLQTSTSRDTAPGGSSPTGDTIIGDRATRPVDVSAGSTPPASALPAPAIRPQAADAFIDHPTNDWVQTCLPDNLRETAYRLPTDCADIAVILRHVWLSAHRRTETFSGWTIGDRQGGAQQQAIGELIGSVYSGNVSAMLNPYADSSGQPLRTFASLQDLLHPGDVLVWEHHGGGLGTARTGGDAETIRSITRTGNTISRIEVIQGNQPIFEDQAREIRPAIGRGAPSEGTLRDAPGRRIEVHEFIGDDLRDVDVPTRRGQAANAPQRLWTWDDGHTTLVAAGPPRAAPRPAAQSSGGRRVRSISDWFATIRSATRDTLTGIFEAALLELRALIEGGQTGLDPDATTLGQTAGERLWESARASRDLSDESHFRPLQRLRALISGLGNPSVQPGNTSAATPRAAEVTRSFNLVDTAFDSAARGATTLAFPRAVRRGTSLVRVLVTGFDPFRSIGRPVPAGTVNPSGDAALALDGSTVNAGNKVAAAVESVVLPVDFGAFRSGMVERIVRPLVQSRGVDAVLTVSLDESIDPADPVRLERFVVGVHNEHTQGSSTEAIPSVAGGPLGPAIIETPTPVDQIAQDTARAASRGTAAIPQPTVGTDVTLRFASAAVADRALRALSLTPSGSAEVTIADVRALQTIVSSMRRRPNGVDIDFTVGSATFRAGVVSGPGGDFLSNEVSYRVLRLLAEEGRTDLPSFHTHVPRALANMGDVIPQDTSTRGAVRLRQQAIATAAAARARLVDTLQNMIRAVARRIVAARGTTP
jgi:pyrrolidone-carboxylate peptidase